MRSAVDFFPSRIKSLMNLATIRSPYFGSGRILRFWTSRRRGIGCPCLAGALGAVFTTAALASLHAHGVEGSADDVVANARKILHATAADHHDGVLLKVVTDAGDVARHLDAVGQ